MKSITINIDPKKLMNTIIDNINNMDLESFKTYAYSQLNSNIKINETMRDTILQRMQKENLTLDNLQ